MIVEGDSIQWVGRQADLGETVASQASERLDLGDATVLPGLIDCHVHLGFDGGPAPVARMRAENDGRQVALMLRSARELLSVGVTTARDLGSRGVLGLTVRDVIADRVARGPRIVAAGGAITTTGGHCWFMGAEADNTREIRHLVRRLHRDGVDCVKIMSTGGYMTKGSAPWFAQFTADEIAEAAREAHRLGKRIAAHCHGTEGIRRAVAAGVDTLEHCSFVDADGEARWDPELGDAIVSSGAYVSPTFNLRTAKLARYRELSLPHLHRAGARIIASTDSGIDNTPHFAYVSGLEAMHDVGGMTAVEVLRAATSVAAQALDVDDVTGRIAPGLDADLIAVDGDPRQDLGVLRHLRLVLARGTAFTPDPLPALPRPAATTPVRPRPRHVRAGALG